MLHSVITIITFAMRYIFRALVEHDFDRYTIDQIYFIASQARHYKCPEATSMFIAQINDLIINVSHNCIYLKQLLFNFLVNSLR